MVKTKRKIKRYTTSTSRRYNLLNFTIKDTFFWDITKYEYLIYGIFDFDDIKLDNEEINFLKTLIKNLKEKQKISKNGNLQKIKILPIFKDLFYSIKKYD